MNRMSASLKHFIPASFHLCGESCPLSHSACMFWNCTLAPPSGSSIKCQMSMKLGLEHFILFMPEAVFVVWLRNSTEYPITHLKRFSNSDQAVEKEYNSLSCQNSCLKGFQKYILADNEALQILSIYCLPDLKWGKMTALECFSEYLCQLCDQLWSFTTWL